MNLGTARTELQARGFDYLPTARCNTFLNRALYILNEQESWPFLEKTVSGTAPLTISDLRQVRYVVAGGSKLAPVDIRDLTDSWPALTDTGTPSYYYYDGTTLKVYPANAVTISVRYLKTGADLSVDADAPDLPARYHQMWLDQTVVLAYRDSDNLEAAAALQAIVDADVVKMRASFMGRNGDSGELLSLVPGASTDW